MAKIKFGDYLKSKKQKEAVYESDESIAKRVEALIESDSCAIQPRFRVDNYTKALDLLAQIPDYPTAEELTKTCQEGLREAKKAVIREDHHIAKYHLETASTEHEYRKASDELLAVCEELRSWQDTSGGDYSSSAQEMSEFSEMLREAETLKDRADAQIVRYSAKTTRHRWTALIVLIAVVAAILYAWISGYAWYLAAKLEGMGGIYESSYSRFYKLGDYLDSRKQYEYYKEKYLRQREHEESLSLPDAEVGDTVEFSGFSWLVLEKEDTKLRMICIAPKEESAFSHVTYDGPMKVLREEMDIEPETADEQEAVSDPETVSGKKHGSDPETVSGQKSGNDSETVSSQEPDNDSIDYSVRQGSASWKDSSLREYLNEIVLPHEFTEAEIAAMELQTSEPTVNPRYTADSGEDMDSSTLNANQAKVSPEESVEDRISILSVEQVEELLEEGVFKKPSVDMWMRTPGADMQSAAYMTSKGNVILYGNDVTDDSLSVCPLILVDYAKLEK